MGIAAQVEAEVAGVLHVVLCLRLRAQHHLVDELRVCLALGAGEDVVEVGGAQHAGFRQPQIEGSKEIGEGQQFLFRRLGVHPVDHRAALALQRLGGGDVRLDHHLLDESVGGEALGHHDALDEALLVEEDFPLWQIEVEGGAALARFGKLGICPPERPQGNVQERLRLAVRAPVDGCLCLLVGELCGRAHDGAGEDVAPFLAPGVERHAHREAWTVLALAQRAEVVGDALRQHRDDAVGKVDRVAARLGLPVEAGAGPHVVCDVCDGDGDDEAALVLGIGLGMHGVVVIARVGGIDGEEGNAAQIRSARFGKGLEPLGFLECRLGEFLRQPMRVHGDEADLALV